ncbi:MAG: phytanoyl-CoA dioxygenase family protein [Planctomycetota bacterium]|nr:phytanoyl-CoA dioxygenase family protein [Planctomycetota bacterium]MDA1142936.1 phytanoyl-CoA dioxygenase family protein [Planctomycetota bacterium]
MLTEKEKWLFDLHGFLHLKKVISPEDVARMVELCDQWHALPDDQLPPPLHTYKDSHTKSSAARAIDHPEYADEVFQRAILNLEIMRVILALTDNCPKSLLVALTKNTSQSDDISFHGGVSGGIRNPANDYQAADGRVFATFLNAAVSLVDVPEGTGFVCIPGSHKSEFKKPEDVDIYDDPPTVFNVCPKAGDVVIFTEALCHGGRKWTHDEPRRTLFMRYSTAYASWSPTAGPLENHRDKISDEIYELKQNAGFQQRKRVVQRLLKELGEA